MSRKILAICDSEPTYARKLMEQICLNQNSELQVRTFSDAGQLFQYSKKHDIDLLLMEDCYQEDVRYKIPAKKRFLLAKDAGQEFYARQSGQETVIPKYQPAEVILRQILGAVAEATKQTTQNDRTKIVQSKTEEGMLVGVYSPVHRIGKTQFALRLAEHLSRDASVLYLNLEEYSGMEYCVPIQEKEHLGDLLYYAKQDPGAFGYRLSTMVSQLGGVDYVQPAPVTRDIRSVQEREWKDLLRQILEKSIYRSVVLDLGDCVQGLFEILRLCDTVYTPYIEEAGAKAKLKQYTDNLRRLGYEDVMEHTIQKEMKQV